MFHTPIEDKDADSTRVALVETVNDPDEPSAFVGAQFDGLDLGGETLRSDETIDLSGVLVQADLDLSEATVDAKLRLDAASVGGTLSMRRLEATAGISCRHLQTGRQWVLSDATIEGRLDALGFSGISFVATDIRVTGGLSVRKATVDGNVNLTRAAVGGPVWLSHTHVGGHFDTEGAVYTGRLTLAHCRVDGDVTLRKTTVKGRLSLEHLDACGAVDATRLHVAEGVDARSSQFGGEADFTEFTATGGPIAFDYARFDAAVSFDAARVESSQFACRNAHFERSVSFVRAAFAGTLTFSGARFGPGSALRMVGTIVGNDVVCDHAAFDGDVYWNDLRVGENVDFSDCTVTTLEFGVAIGGRLDFAYTYVSERADFTDTVVHGPARFTCARFDTNPSLSDAALNGDVAVYDLSVHSPETH
ncbi:hypothetical protein ACFQJC_03975 [Haloferax namakaokahaiae]|uniref:Pentapeptide repeat-containing protein n=1 Tax=Haloferax namakaokahaiae TaxID=1748331 RepID=A0ABD5ZBJ5_9EURY